MRTTGFLVFFFGWMLSGPLAGQQWRPAELPDYTLQIPGGELCDHLFLTVYRAFIPSPKEAACMLLDREGRLLWYNSRYPYLYDFKALPNGGFTYFFDGRHFLLDSTLSITDSLRPQGRIADPHEYLALPNGERFILGFSTEDSIDLSGILTKSGAPGSTNGSVQANAVQQIDAYGNLLKEWYSYPYFSPNEIDQGFFTNPTTLPLTHTNSIDWDPSGKILLSHRHMSQLNLLDWQTGNILWRFGGLNNQFLLVNDTLGISGQHDARFLPSSRISVFDNGNFHRPRIARALIYQMDTVNMQAVLEWEYTRSISSDALGSFRVVPNGNRIINWGLTRDLGHGEISYTDSSGNLLQEIHLEDDYYSYRAICQDLPIRVPHPELTCRDSAGFTILEVAGNHHAFRWNTGSTQSFIAVRDSGSYFAYVDHGDGMILTETFLLHDPDQPCNGVSILDPLPSERKSLGWFDLLGRKVERPEPGNIYIERFSDGTTRKVMQWR